MVQVNGILSSLAVSSLVVAENQMLMTATNGATQLVNSNNIKVVESGYYIISASITGKTATIGNNLISQASIAIILQHNTVTYRFDCLGRPTASSGSTNLAQAQCCMCLFLKANDTVTFKWINWSSLTTNADGVFNVSQIVPISSVAGTLTSAAVAVNAQTKYPCTLTATENALALTGNNYKCTTKGLILVTAYMELTSTVNTSRFVIGIRHNSTDFIGEQWVDSSAPLTACISISKLFLTEVNDTITFFFVASGSGTTVTPSKGTFTIVKL